MLLELWTKEYPFKHSCSSPIELVQTLEDITRVEDLVQLRNCPHHMQDFIADLLEKDPSKRASSGYDESCARFQFIIYSFVLGNLYRIRGLLTSVFEILMMQ